MIVFDTTFCYESLWSAKKKEKNLEFPTYILIVGNSLFIHQAFRETLSQTLCYLTLLEHQK